ncbi:hypothetical protein HHK36_000803 [Tetracentron sinense]|uniref:Uncharacterized protein n=1 Tax=Tetracentron sinense TaxID=13715 RepID=A0A835DUC5_TETSI|nr:hypothetical protein HHK36_000803 [Tetracentron sinense]
MGIREVEIAGKKLIIHELDDVIDPVTGRALTGSWVWDSSLVLSEWMLSHGLVEFDLQGKIVIELGAGTGLPGLTAALLGAERVILTDVALLLPGLQRNVEANGLRDRVEVRELVWGSDEECPSHGGELAEVDLVLMSDVFYDPLEMEALATTLKKVCGKGTRIWSASEIRSWTGECLDRLMSEGFGVIEFPSRLGPSCSLSMIDDSPPLFAVYHLVPNVMNV